MHREVIGMQKFDSINVIPFVDIMLVLLAIVLTTATFVNNGDLPINLPGATATPSNDNSPMIEIAVAADGTHYLDGEIISLSLLKQKLKVTNNQTLINVRVDEVAEFSHFVSIIDQLKAQSFEKISIATRKSG